MLKDLVLSFSPKDMCMYCREKNTCMQKQVSAPKDGETTSNLCANIDVYINEFFDKELYFRECTDGIVICQLCKNEDSCRTKLSECKNIDKLKIPCDKGYFKKEWFEEEVFDALFIVTAEKTSAVQGSISFEIEKKEQE